jgi:hypothetical protein
MAQHTHRLAPLSQRAHCPPHGAADTHTNATAATTVSTVLSTISTPLVGYWKELFRKACWDSDNLVGLAISVVSALTILISVQLKFPYHKRSCNNYNGLTIQLVALLVDSSDLDEYLLYSLSCMHNCTSQLALCQLRWHPFSAIHFITSV